MGQRGTSNSEAKIGELTYIRRLSRPELSIPDYRLSDDCADGKEKPLGRSILSRSRKR
jgi:hypothetical protein